MIGIDPAVLEEFTNACRQAADFSLVRCSSGNLSRRSEADALIISASRSWMSRLTPEQIALCRISSAEHLAGPRPSVETVFHAGILRRRKDVNVVLHFQSNAATTLACSRGPVNYNIIPEIPFYIGYVGAVEYLPPGSHELAERVIEEMTECDLAQLANHGQVVVGRDYADAIQKAVFFELACEVLLRSGEKAEHLDDAAVNALMRAAKADGKV